MVVFVVWCGCVVYVVNPPVGWRVQLELELDEYQLLAEEEYDGRLELDDGYG